MNIFSLFSVFIGGGIGAVLRWVLVLVAVSFSQRLWLATLFANIIGSALFFLTIKYNMHLSKEAQFFIRTGILGALTTFSTFTYEIVSLLKSGSTFEALLVFVLNIFFGIIIGIWVLR